MPHQNCVDPFGNLRATAARGALIGNRGCLHDEAGQIREAFARKAWVTYQLQWKGIQRKVFSPGRYADNGSPNERHLLSARLKAISICSLQPSFGFRFVAFLS